MDILKALSVSDMVALAMAFGFARLAVASQRRARNGDPNSVWAD